MTPKAVGGKKEGGASREHNERFRLKFYPSFEVERFGAASGGTREIRRCGVS